MLRVRLRHVDLTGYRLSTKASVDALSFTAFTPISEIFLLSQKKDPVDGSLLGGRISEQSGVYYISKNTNNFKTYMAFFALFYFFREFSK